jgi:release factor glutamine methyltransferase
VDPDKKTDVYLPSEDTATLARVLRSYSGDRCLEIGFGSGVILDSLLERFNMVVGTDLVSGADAVTAKGGSEVVRADRATCFQDGTFDVVAFNPPYLPSEGIEDPTVDGGKGGLEVPMAFLEDGLRVLKREGAIVMLLSDEADLDDFRGRCERRGLAVQEKGKTELFFENLYVFEVRRA